MKKLIIPIIVAVIALGIGAVLVLEKPAFPEPLTSNLPNAFFAVHFEPRSADQRGFEDLKKFVQIADNFKVKLTLQFTPSWAKMILADENKLGLLRQWQTNGHEIAAHHHGANHSWEWDGYTNLSAAEWQKARQDVYGRSGQNKKTVQNLVKQNNLGEKYFGSMDDYMTLYKQLAGPEKIFTMSMGPDRKTDWPKEIPYSLDNIIMLPNGDYTIGGTAIIKLKKETYSGHNVSEIDMRFIENMNEVEKAKEEYLRASPDDVIGVVTHIEDFASDPNVPRAWMEFINKKNPSGERNKTVAEVMKNLITQKEQPKEQKETQKTVGDNSPFGFHPAYTFNFPVDRSLENLTPENIAKLPPPPAADSITYKHAFDIGIKWNRLDFYAKWQEIQDEKDLTVGNFNWERLNAVINAVPKGIYIVANIDGIAGLEDAIRQKRVNFTLEEMKQKYAIFVKELAERYDGDGNNDMPGLENPIKYWQIDNEPELYWKNDWRGYADVMKISYQAIKTSCSDCKVIIGGLAGGLDGFNRFYLPIIRELNGSYIDIFDFHYFGPAGAWSDYKNLYNAIKQNLVENNYKNTEIWITETGTGSGTLNDGERVMTQTEKQQAEEVIKRYVYGLSLGTKKIFWAFGLMEGFQDTDGFFDHTGFIYDGKGNNDIGYGVKKLAYYTYKKMVEVLDGSDWNNIQTIQEKDGIYVYKFTKAGKPIWVVWNDNSSSKQITISGISSGSVKITEAVPKYESGKEVVNYSTAFNTETKTVSGGKISITLSDKPVFVEGK